MGSAEQDLADFFDFSKPFKRFNITGGTTGGRVRSTPDVVQEIRPRVVQRTDYTRKYVEEDREQLCKVSETRCAGVVWFTMAAPDYADASFVSRSLRHFRKQENRLQAKKSI